MHYTYHNQADLVNRLLFAGMYGILLAPCTCMPTFAGRACSGQISRKPKGETRQHRPECLHLHVPCIDMIPM